ncbi:MAG: CDP-diacylglycerol--glycerol-3-phosphate 3-phosphatidyltransferase [Planctomycetales bacterium]|nr:CDP-diacylglycerol--glycerol-3-phosphate 3-phosphatidyltransferase [Planctomycetales bacterium]
MNTPLLLTASRIVLAPVFLVVFFLPTWTGHAEDASWLVPARALALALALSFEVTDVLDGRLARRWRQVTELGKYLDPLADSISRFTVFLCFLAAGYVPVWMVALIFYRDTIIAGLRIAGASQNVIIAARTWGKAKAVLQGIVILVVLAADLADAAGAWPGTFPAVPHLATWLMGLVTAVTVLSSVDYFRGHGQVIRRVLAESGTGANPSPGKSPRALPQEPAQVSSA